MDRQCTWFDPPDKRCELAALHEHRGEDGLVWADLCEMHHVVMEDASDKMLKPSEGSYNIKWMLRCWVRASGGPKKMAERM